MPSRLLCTHMSVERWPCVCVRVPRIKTKQMNEQEWIVCERARCACLFSYNGTANVAENSERHRTTGGMKIMFSSKVFRIQFFLDSVLFFSRSSGSFEYWNVNLVCGFDNLLQMCLDGDSRDNCISLKIHFFGIHLNWVIDGRCQSTQSVDTIVGQMAETSNCGTLGLHRTMPKTQLIFHQIKRYTFAKTQSNRKWFFVPLIFLASFARSWMIGRYISNRNRHNLLDVSIARILSFVFRVHVSHSVCGAFLNARIHLPPFVGVRWVQCWAR